MHHPANAHCMTGPAGDITGWLFLSFGRYPLTGIAIVHWVACINTKTAIDFIFLLKGDQHPQ